MRTVRDCDVRDKKILVRVDFNVPIEAGAVTDNTRIRASLPTLQYLLEKGARLSCISHLGRPKGKVVDAYRMDPVALELSKLLGRKVVKLDDCVGDMVKEAVESAEPGTVILLENVRFHSEEEKNDPGFAAELARGFDLFVNDAFGAAHRAHASTEGVTHYLPSYAGFLLEKEVSVLSELLNAPRRPFAAIIGGAKVSDKIEVITNLLQRVDLMLLGGGMANTFLMAKGIDVGRSLAEADKVGLAGEILARHAQVVLPIDCVVAPSLDAGEEAKVVAADQVPPGFMILDIGPETVKLFADRLAGAGTVFWNGPMGVFEKEAFAAGTRGVARAVAGLGARTVVGGGDSIAALQQSGLSDRIWHISTGGGASLEFLEGKVLPGIARLEDEQS
ncbi:MAG: phosphoglycerate kinase [Bacillota bacterium]